MTIPSACICHHMIVTCPNLFVQRRSEHNLCPTKHFKAPSPMTLIQIQSPPFSLTSPASIFAPPLLCSAVQDDVATESLITCSGVKGVIDWDESREPWRQNVQSQTTNVGCMKNDIRYYVLCRNCVYICKLTSYVRIYVRISSIIHLSYIYIVPLCL